MATRDVLAARIDMAMGRRPVDLLITNARVVDVFNQTVFETSVGIGDGLFVGFGEFEAEEIVDAQGRYLMPGFTDGHVHIESSMVSPRQFVRTILPRGTTTVIADPHEIANVLGVGGIRYILEATRDVPLDVRVMLPSCVPATPFEHAGAVLEAADLAPMMGEEGVLGLGEVMNYPGVTGAVPEVLDKIALAHDSGRVADGHSPGVAGQELGAYAAAGIHTDHECSTVEEMQERLRLGMYVLVREGSAAKNLRELIKAVTPANARRVVLCTDDREPADLLSLGHIDHNLRLAVEAGLDPLQAVCMATLNAAECYGLKGKGAVAPGYDADFVLIDDLESFAAHAVFVGGKHVAQDGELTIDLPEYESGAVTDTVRVAALDGDAFALKLDCPRANVIRMLPGSIVTEAVVRDVALDSDGLFHASSNPGLSKLAVIERHNATGNMGTAIVENYGITGGAIATTVAHDSHNVVVIGDNDADMLAAVRDLEAIGGGTTIVRRGEILAHLPLPIAGLMSDGPVEDAARKLEGMLDLAWSELGINRDLQPFMNLSFLSLPVIPELKLTDAGLFDVRTFSFADVCAG